MQSSINFSRPLLLKNFIFISILFIANLIERKKDIITYISEKPVFIRWGVYYLTLIILITFGNFGIQELISVKGNHAQVLAIQTRL